MDDASETQRHRVRNIKPNTNGRRTRNEQAIHVVRLLSCWYFLFISLSLCASEAVRQSTTPSINHCPTSRSTKTRYTVPSAIATSHSSRSQSVRVGWVWWVGSV